MAYFDDFFGTKKADFYTDKIVIKKKKGNITINRAEIDKICYARPTLSNYLFAEIHQLLPGQLAIWLKKPVSKPKKAGYVIWMKYKDFQKLPGALMSLTELY